MHDKRQCIRYRNNRRYEQNEDATKYFDLSKYYMFDQELSWLVYHTHEKNVPAFMRQTHISYSNPHDRQFWLGAYLIDNAGLCEFTDRYWLSLFAYAQMFSLSSCGSVKTNKSNSSKFKNAPFLAWFKIKLGPRNTYNKQICNVFGSDVVSRYGQCYEQEYKMILIYFECNATGLTWSELKYSKIKVDFLNKSVL